jgi:hypothetical protein
MSINTLSLKARPNGISGLLLLADEWLTKGSASLAPRALGPMAAQAGRWRPKGGEGVGVLRPLCTMDCAYAYA